MPTDRNHGINQWLEDSQAEYLIQCDQDMVPPVDAVMLAAHGLDLVACPYLCTSEKGPRVAAAFADEKPVLPWDPEKDERVVEVFWFGTGCYCLRRGAALRMIEAFGRVFDFDFDERGEKGLGVDIQLSHRMRQIGLRPHVDRAMIAGHSKGQMWVPQPHTGALTFFPWATFWESGKLPLKSEDIEPPDEVFARVRKKIATTA